MQINLLWIIQTNMGSASDIMEYVAAVRRSGACVAEIEHIPFSGNVPDIEHDGPVVVYGSVNFVTAAQASGRWSPGVFADPSVFTYDNWVTHYGDLLLNSSDAAQKSTIGDFVSDDRDADEDIFVRPQHDSKSINGQVWRAGDFRAYCLDVSKGGYADVDASTPILVATPYGIAAEWRLFVAGGEIVGATQYKSKGRLNIAPGAPEEIMAFGRYVIDRWDPAPAYVLDVCTSAGNPYIVEAQGFNSAGQYNADLNSIVAAVNRVALRCWNSAHLLTAMKDGASSINT